MSIIKEIQQLGHHVIIGADEQPLAFLQQEFPALPIVRIPGYKVEYSRNGNGLKLFFEGVRFYQFIKKEHKVVEQIVSEHHIDVIISDNRYGLWSRQTKSILITHQVFVKTPLLSSWFQKKIRQLITNFDECWIPDVGGHHNLSGDLSHLEKINFPHRFIGLQSRFKHVPDAAVKYDIVAIVSGPEPQRTIFYNQLYTQLKKSQLKSALVAGNPLVAEKKEDGDITIFSHLPTSQMQELIAQSSVVICRSGYSSIMDMVAMQKKAILIPTPGQTEQEFLANYHLRKRHFYSQSQDKFDLEKALLKLEAYTPPKMTIEPLSFDFQ